MINAQYLLLSKSILEFNLDASYSKLAKCQTVRSAILGNGSGRTSKGDYVQ